MTQKIQAARETDMEDARCKNNEQGSVTVELALGITALLAVLLLVVAAIGVASAQGLACADARVSLREAIRGGSQPTADSVVTTTRHDKWITVEATRHVSGGALLGYEQVSCAVTGVDEQYEIHAHE